MNIFDRISVILLFAALHQIQGKNKNECLKLRNEFVVSLTDFDQCALKYAVPVTMCTNCVGQYVTILRTFYNLTTTVDPLHLRERCGDHFMDHDSLNVFRQRYQNARDLWNGGACTNCFVSACDPDKLASGNADVSVCVLNTQTTAFLNSSAELTECTTKQQNICKDCLKVFNSVKDNYKNSETLTSGHVCFDVVDQFNRSSELWYDGSKCPRPDVPKTPITLEVILVLVAILLLSGMSYGGFYAFKMYRQRISYTEQVDADSGNITPPIYS